MKNCQVCGRTPEEIEEEFGLEMEISEHQGIDKCSKCIQEYKRELGVEEDAVSSPEFDEPEDVGDWKDQVIA